MHDGRVYGREWKNGKRQEGEKIINRDGSLEKDEENRIDIKDGYNEYTYPNEDKYKGEWENSVREGHDVLTKNNNIVNMKENGKMIIEMVMVYLPLIMEVSTMMNEK